MHSILVVDDFELDRIEIIKTIESFTDLPVFVVGAAQNADEAIEILMNYQPEILICDVEMPGISGIELAEKAMNCQKDLHVIFVSLYDKVHYLQDAIRLHCDGYLMKPVSSSELRDALTQIFLQKTIFAKHQQEMQSLHGLMKEHRGAISREFFSDLLLTGGQTETDLESRMLQIGLKPKQYFWIALMEMNMNDAIAMQANENNRLLVSYVFYQKLRSFANQTNPYYAVRLNEFRYAIVFCFENHSASNRKTVTAVLRQLQGQLQSSGITVSTAISNEVENIHQLYALYELLALRLSERRFYCGDDIIFANDDPALPETLDMPDIRFLQTEVRLLLETEIADLSAAAKNYAEKLLENCTPSLARLYCSYVRGIVSFIAEEKGTRVFLRAKNDDSPASLEECRDEIISLVFSGYTAIHQQQTGEENQLIQDIQQYILNTDLKTACLHQIAEHFSYSPNYLNHVFKTATGLTILDCITNCRINRAKALMHDTDMNLNEIAKEVGYSHATYLTIVFKKKEGMTPKSYMELMRS